MYFNDQRNSAHLGRYWNLHLSFNIWPNLIVAAFLKSVMRSPICSIKYTDTLGSYTIIQSYIDYNAMFFFINNTNASVRYFSLYKQCVKQADHIMIEFHHFLLLFSFSLSFCYRKYDAHRFTTKVDSWIGPWLMRVSNVSQKILFYENCLRHLTIWRHTKNTTMPAHRDIL